MSIPLIIEALINRRTVDSARLEFMDEYRPDRILHTTCAFANDIDNICGGFIVIGVRYEAGGSVLKVKGIEPSSVDRILNQLHGLCRNISPQYCPVIEPVIYEGKRLIVIQAPGGFERPYSASVDVRAEDKRREYYIRKSSGTVAASEHEREELFYISSTIPFDDRPNLAASVSDLSRALIRKHPEETNSSLTSFLDRKSEMELAEDLQLVVGPPEQMYPRNVGILMFSERIHDYFPHAYIEVTKICDPTGKDIYTRKFTGPVQEQYRGALSYLKDFLEEKTVKRKGFAEADQFWNYPFAAFEEILSNAVCHRSYQIPEPVRIRITPEAVEFVWHSLFDRAITCKTNEKLQICSNYYRNRRIGNFLEEAGIIDAQSDGFAKTILALKDNGSPAPSFVIDPNRSYFSVTVPIHPGFLPKRAENDEEYREKIIDNLRDGPKSMTNLARALGYKGITKKLDSSVSTLEAKGRIVKISVKNHVLFALKVK